jgi:23S rRNA pseudouridine1911/1915/1917 synthase
MNRPPDDEEPGDLDLDSAPDDEDRAPPGTRVRTIRVGAVDGKVRLDKYLLEQEAGFSRMRFKHLIDGERVRVNGAVARASRTVRSGDEIVVEFPPPRPLAVTAEAIPLDLLYEDEHLVVVNKAAGMVVHPAAGHFEGTLVHALLHHCRGLSGIGGVLRPGIVHRLDKGTSGVLVVAKGDAAHVTLQKMFKLHQIEKTYLAITVGVPRDREGTMQSFIARHPLNRQKMASVTAGGKWAVTHFRVLADYGRFAKLQLDLETGRTHQIRVHLSDRRTPILGDATYGGRLAPEGVRDPVLRECVRALDRPALHARRLAFSHPITGEPLDLTAPVPSDMAAVLARLDELKKEDG